MKTARVSWLVLGLCGIGVVQVEDPYENLMDLNPCIAERVSEEARHQLVGKYDQMPLSFEANQGQTDDPVHFLSRGSGYTLFLTSDEAVFSLRQLATEEPDSTTFDVLRIQLIGACPNPQAMGTDVLPGQSNYLIGDDPAQWHLNVPHYAKVHYQDIYPGIDLVYYGNQRQLEYDFIVAPGVNSENIQMRFAGAERLGLDEGGQLVLHMAKGQVVLRTPIAYQEVGGTRRAIECKYALLGKYQVGFSVGSYDAGEPLVIDPTLSYSTYLGSSGIDIGRGIAVDDSGNAYITGIAGSTDFPKLDPLQTAYGGGNSDAFVVKLNASGSAVYSTYLGGRGFDSGDGIAVDSLNNVYVTGSTSSINFPTVKPLQAAHGGGEGDAFVVKLNASGSSFTYSTYLGGSGYDSGSGIAVERSGNAYVTGTTSSSNFPTVNLLQVTHAGGSDAFVVKLNASGSNLIYATYLGGTERENGMDIAVDSSGNAYISGITVSTDFPTVNPVQAVYGGGLLGDAFVAKLNASGSALIYSTYLGGGGLDEGWGIAVDGSGNAYVVGTTSSTNFPTVNPLQAIHGADGGIVDAFVTKLDASGSAIYSTYLGGNSRDNGYGIAVDGSGNAYVTGTTSSINFPTVNSLQPERGGGGQLQPDLGDVQHDVFVVKLEASGSGLAFATYLGGSDRDLGWEVALDGAGNIYVTGETSSRDFPTLHPLQSVHAGGDTSAPFGGLRDAFVTKIAPPPVSVIAVSPSPLSFGSVMVGQSKSLTLTASNTGTDTLFISSVSISGTDASQFSISPNRLTVPAGGSGSVVVTFTPTPGEAKSAILTLNHNAAPTVTATTVPLSGTGDTPPANPFQPYTADPYTMALVHFDEGRGTTAVDHSGNRNTGRLNSGTRWTKAGRFSSAVNFTGSNFISIRSSASLSATAALTVEAWIYPRRYTTQWNAGIVAKWGTRGTGDDSYELALTPSGQVSFRTSDGTGTEVGTSSILSSAIVPLNTWTHVAGTFTKGGSIKIYINGSLDKSVPARNVNIQTTTQEVWVGQAEQGPLRNIRFSGYIDEVRISSIARTYISNTARTSGNVLDVNGDGIVSVGDAILILEIIASEKPDTDAADANGDGKIDVQDALLVLRNLTSAKPAAVYSFFRARLENSALEEKVIVLEGFSQMALGHLVFEYDPEIVDDLQLRTAGDAFLISPQDDGKERVIVNLLRIHKGKTPDDRLFITVKSRSAGGVVQLVEASLVDWKAQAYTMSRPIAVEFQTSPRAIALFPNYPNPFNPETIIRYHLPEQVKMRLEIYDLLGQQVRLLADQIQPAGKYQVVWDGRDEQGVPVSSGIYFYRLQAGSFTAVRRLALVK